MKHFFISYNSADRSWAEWIAWHLEEAGYEVVDASNGMEGIDRYRRDPGADQFTAKMHGRKS